MKNTKILAEKKVIAEMGGCATNTVVTQPISITKKRQLFELAMNINHCLDELEGCVTLIAGLPGDKINSHLPSIYMSFNEVKEMIQKMLDKPIIL